MIFNFVFGNDRPILNERFSKSGTISGHYFHQDLFVARKIFIPSPNKKGNASQGCQPRNIKNLNDGSSSWAGRFHLEATEKEHVA